MKPTILAIILLFCATASSAQSALEKQLFDLVNREREKAGVSKLEWNDNLARAALRHSQLLDEHQELSHQFAREPSLQERVGVTGTRFNAVAENVAQAQEADGARRILMRYPAEEVENAHKGLMESPGHRANILSPAYNAIGISIVQDGQQLYVTQDFAHIMPSYNEQQIRDALVTGFNKARRTRGLGPINVMIDAQLRKAACAQDMNTDRMIQGLPGAGSLLVFSMSEPGALPESLRKTAADKTLERMNIGVCLQTGGQTGFSKFWVVAAFYRSVD
jgi:hypothetical protein